MKTISRDTHFLWYHANRNMGHNDAFYNFPRGDHRMRFPLFVLLVLFAPGTGVLSPESAGFSGSDSLRPNRRSEIALTYVRKLPTGPVT